ncbi:MAG: Gfo/Idh/MocA family oxidoreductase [Gemmataceae bacterium]|nr:Gfo/Idh/MocA family oxidoreductase [Gemmataceae bacterium]
MRPTADRRDFLKAAAASAGAAASVNLAGAFAAGNETIKVGLIGCGGRGTGAVRNILDAEDVLNPGNGKVEIVAVADAFKERAQAAADQFRAVDRKSKDPNKKDEKSPFFKYAAQVKLTPDTVFDGLDAYQKVLGAGVDLVILATPPGFRPLHLEAAVRAGKNVFCEKPVAVDAAGIRKCFELVDESKRKNIAIVAGTQRRHQKGYIETIKKIHDGAIGDIRAARCAWNGSGIWFNERRPGEKDAHYQVRNWYHFLWLCGDHIVEQHVHNLDVVNWVMQAHPVRAVGFGGRATRPVGEPAEVGQIWDHFAVEYDYPNGVRLASYCRHIPGDNDISETIVGTKGTCRVDQYRIGREEVGSDDRDAYVQEHIDLLNSIRAGRPLNELKAVTESTFTAILGRNAAYACKTLKWDDALAANDATMPPGLTLESSVPVSPAPTPGSWKLPARKA